MLLPAGTHAGAFAGLRNESSNDSFLGPWVILNLY